MNALTDQQLLSEYAANRSEAAFKALVFRHIDLVHSAALRIVRNAHTAEDVTQAVFTALSKDAGRLSGHPVIAGWLHRTTRHLAAQTIRTEARRRLREQRAIAMNEQVISTSDSEPLWSDIAPHLDAALGELSDSDRDAVILRFFEKRSAKEIASQLGISAESAQKRVNRAVERLRECFARRGVSVSSGVLTVAIPGHAVQAAPAGLAAKISAGALAGSAITATTTTLVMNTLQKMLVPLAVLGLAGTWLHQNQEANELRSQVVPIVQQRQASKLTARNGNLPKQASVLMPVATTGNPRSFVAPGYPPEAGVDTEEQWYEMGPGPTVQGMDGLGRPTTVMIEMLELSEEEVAALEAAVRRIRQEATADFVERLRLKGHGKEEDGNYHYHYDAPARDDRGQYFFEGFTKAFVAAIGEERGKRFRRMMEEDQFLGGMGRYDLEIDLYGASEESINGVRIHSREPGSGKISGRSDSSMDSFEMSFGKVFDFPEGKPTYPTIPIRSLPESP